jgi:hypothetical protein
LPKMPFQLRVISNSGEWIKVENGLMLSHRPWKCLKLVFLPLLSLCVCLSPPFLGVKRWKCFPLCFLPMAPAPTCSQVTKRHREEWVSERGGASMTIIINTNNKNNNNWEQMASSTKIQKKKRKKKKRQTKKDFFYLFCTALPKLQLVFSIPSLIHTHTNTHTSKHVGNFEHASWRKIKNNQNKQINK